MMALHLNVFSCGVTPQHRSHSPFLSSVQPYTDLQSSRFRSIPYSNATSANLDTTASHPTAQSPLPIPTDLHATLDLVHQASCVLRHGSTVTISGGGVHLGMESLWTLNVRPDGAFREEVQCPPYVASACGYDGGENNAAWDVDSYGVPQMLELDDHEGVVLATWIRSGVWTFPALRSRLDIEQLSSSSNSMKSSEEDQKEEQKTDLLPTETDLGIVLFRVSLRGGRLSALVSIDSSTWQTQSMVLQLCGDSEEWTFHDWKAWNSTTESSTVEAGIRGEAIEGGAAHHPSRIMQDSKNGGNQELSVVSVKLHPLISGTAMAASAEIILNYSTTLPSSSTTNPNDVDVEYSMPEYPVLPEDTIFLPGVDSAVPAWHTPSGHLLVQGIINGQSADKAGYFILDTGASGFVIEPAAADALELPAFGELHITGVSGKCQGQFRKADSFQLGPMVISDPVMMEMTLTGLVRGAPGPVVGIIGFEIFRRAVVDIPPKPLPRSARDTEMISPAAAFAYSLNKTSKKRKNTTNSSSTTTTTPQAYVHLHHPGDAHAANAAIHSPTDWVPVIMLASLPHVHCTLRAFASEQEHQQSKEGGESIDSSPSIVLNKEPTALLMVDTGAGGMEVMLNSRGADAAGLDMKKKGKGWGSRAVRGVGGAASNSITLETASVEEFHVGGASFQGVKCLVAGEGIGGGVELSHYSGGILCGDLLTRCRVVVDLARKRIGIVRKEGEDEE